MGQHFTDKPNLSTVFSNEISLQMLLPASIVTWKLMGGGGFLGSIRTTLDSTLGGGRKLFLPTWKPQNKFQQRQPYKILYGEYIEKMVSNDVEL